MRINLKPPTLLMVVGEQGTWDYYYYY